MAKMIVAPLSEEFDASSLKRVTLKALWRPSIAALVVGVFYTVFLIGAERINVSNVAWLQNIGDPTQAFLGWSFLRLDPVWHFPPTYTTWLGWPLGVSVGFTDSIPLVAIVARLLLPVLPLPFQYFGLWTLANFVLSAYFAIRICMSFTGRFNAAALVGAVLLLIAPCMTGRVLYHIALSSHFLILLSIWLYFRPYPKAGWWRLTMPQVGVVALAASIHPYLLVMTGAISVAFFGRHFVVQRAPLWTTALSLGVVIATAASLLWFFGYFVGGDVANYAGYGYPYYSFNLLAPFNSMGLSTFIPPIDVADVRQREGFNYLGLGVFFLLGLNLRSIVRSLSRLVVSEHGPLVAVCVILTLLATSTLVTLGSFVILDVKLPDLATHLLAAFRASGRFFWPVGYLILIGAIYLTLRNYGRRYGTALLAIALVTQFADEAPLRQAVRARIENSRPSPLVADRWEHLGQSVKRLIVLPAWQCGASHTPGGPAGFGVFGSLAASQGLETNNVYLARIGPKASDIYCRAMPDRFRRGQIERDTAYVISDDLVRWARRASSLKCERVDGFNLCLPLRQPELKPGKLVTYTKTLRS